MQLAAGDRERVAQRGEHALGDDAGLARVGDVLEQHGELVAAHARHGVAGADGRVEPARDGAQQLVPDGMPERVVHDLEAVEVEEEDRAAAAGPPPAGPSQRLLEPVEEQRPVRQPGQRVVHRGVLEPLDRAPVVGGVADGALQRDHVQPRLRQVVDGAGQPRPVHRVGAARVAEQDDLRARILLQQAVQRGVVGQRDVDEHGVVRVLGRGREAGCRARHPVHLRLRVGEQIADQATVGLVGCDKEENEGRIGHSPGSDRMAASFPEQ